MGFFTTAGEWIDGRIDDANSWVKDRVEDVKDFGEDVADWAGDRVDDVKDFGEDVADWAGDRVEDVQEFGENASAFVVGLGHNAYETACDWVHDAGGKIYAFGEGAIEFVDDNVIEPVADVYAKGEAFIVGCAENAKEELEERIDQIGTVVCDIRSDVLDHVHEWSDTAHNFVNEMIADGNDVLGREDDVQVADFETADLESGEWKDVSELGLSEAQKEDLKKAFDEAQKNAEKDQPSFLGKFTDKIKDGVSSLANAAKEAAEKNDTPAISGVAATEMAKGLAALEAKENSEPTVKEQEDEGLTLC